MKKFYLTTPLYYVNDVPHIGHAYTTIAADVLARWQRLSGKDVFFLTGTDEHGAKIAKAAEEAGENPQDFVNRISGEYRRLWSALNITYDDFIQTSEERHKKVVQDVFNVLIKSGDIYLGSYEGWYCLSDESYFSESELVDKKCPSCGREVQKLKEDSYFFKLENYEGQLKSYFDANKEFLSPPHRANEIRNFVDSGLKNLSVSRTRVQWGIPIAPGANHTVYVWFDALLNYLSAPTSKSVDAWPADVHLVGKEIYRFHTVIWPAMLMALHKTGYLKEPFLPEKVFAHGWWTVEGTKMSKSLGNVVNPHEMIERYGADAFRYFLLREVPFGSDGDFSEKALLSRFNTELANNLGNLLQRTSTLLLKHFDGEITHITDKSILFKDWDPKVFEKINSFYDHLQYNFVLDHAYDHMVRTNQFIDEKAPWKLAADQKDQLKEILFECAIVLKYLALLLYPFMPVKMQELWNRLGEQGDIKEEGKKALQFFKEGRIPPFKQGQKVLKSDPLFMRMGGRWK